MSSLPRGDREHRPVACLSADSEGQRQILFAIASFSWAAVSIDLLQWLLINLRRYRKDLSRPGDGHSKVDFDLTRLKSTTAAILGLYGLDCVLTGLACF
jgi:hypothetical protein